MTVGENRRNLFEKFFSKSLIFLSFFALVAIGIYHSPTFTNYIKHRMTGSSGMADNHSMSSSASSLLMEEGPNDGQVTRKVKRAYGAIDAFR